MHNPIYRIESDDLSLQNPVYHPLLRGVVLGRAFAFLSAAFWQEPPLDLLRDVLKAETFTDRIWPLLTPQGASVFRTKVHAHPLPSCRPSALLTDRAIYTLNSTVHIAVLDPTRPHEPVTLLLQHQGTTVDRIPLVLDACGSATASWRPQYDGVYTVSYADLSQYPNATFEVAASLALSVSNISPHDTPIVALSSFGHPSTLSIQKHVAEPLRSTATPNPDALFSLRRTGPFSALLEIHTQTHLVCVTCVDPTMSRGTFPHDAPHPSLVDEAYRRAEDLFDRGHTRKARKTLLNARKKIGREDSPHPYYAYYIACCYALEGHAERSVLWLRTALRDGFDDFEHLATDSDLKALHDHPAFPFLCGGGSVSSPFVYPKQGVSLPLPVCGSLCTVWIGSWINGSPWEGYALMVETPRLEVSVEAPAMVLPSAEVSLHIRTPKAMAVHVAISEATQTPPQIQNAQVGPVIHLAQSLAQSASQLPTATLVEHINSTPNTSILGPLSNFPGGFNRGWSSVCSVSTSEGQALAEFVAPSHETKLRVDIAALSPEGWSFAQTSMLVEGVAWVKLHTPRHLAHRDLVFGEVSMRIPEGGARLVLTHNAQPVPHSFESDSEQGALSSGLHRARFALHTGQYTARLLGAQGEVYDETSVSISPLGERVADVYRAALFLPNEVCSLRDTSLHHARAVSSMVPLMQDQLRALSDPLHLSCMSIAASVVAAVLWASLDLDEDNVREVGVYLSLARRRLEGLWVEGKGLRATLSSLEHTSSDHVTDAARLLLLTHPLKGTAQTTYAHVVDLARISEIIHDVARVYGLLAQSKTPKTPEEAFWIIRSEASDREQANAFSAARAFAQTYTETNVSTRQRAAQAYVAATLLRSAEPEDVRRALSLTRHTLAHLPTSHQDAPVAERVAVLVLLGEVENADLLGGDVLSRSKGEWSLLDEHTVNLPTEVDALKCTDHALCLVYLDRVDRDLSSFENTISMRVALEVEEGRATRCVDHDDRVSLVVEVHGGAVLGDIVRVELPSALRSVYHDSREDVIEVDLQDRERVAFPLRASEVTLDAQGRPTAQHFAVSVRNVFDAQRVGFVGPLSVVVFARDEESKGSEHQGGDWSVQAQALPLESAAQPEEEDDNGLIGKTFGAFKKLFDRE